MLVSWSSYPTIDPGLLKSSEDQSEDVRGARDPNGSSLLDFNIITSKRPVEVVT